MDELLPPTLFPSSGSWSISSACGSIYRPCVPQANRIAPMLYARPMQNILTGALLLWIASYISIPEETPPPGLLIRISMGFPASSALRSMIFFTNSQADSGEISPSMNTFRCDSSFASADTCEIPFALLIRISIMRPHPPIYSHRTD